MGVIVWEHKRGLTELAETVGDKKTGVFTITLGRHASTTTKLHELRHAMEKHYSGRMLMSRLVDRELDATIWSFQTMGRPITWLTFTEVCEALMRFGHKGRYALYPILGGLFRRGITLTYEEKNNLLAYIEMGEITV